LVQLARTLGMEVIAEGVDDVEQIDELLRLDCRDAQGYFFSRPLPAMAATAAVQTGLDVPQWGHAYTAQEAGSGDAASKDTEGS
jgi:predicted signal transduction protein with EAL and GGDEF domain